MVSPRRSSVRPCIDAPSLLAASFSLPRFPPPSPQKGARPRCSMSTAYRSKAPAACLELLRTLPDPRKRRGSATLGCIVAIAPAPVWAGPDFEAMAQWPRSCPATAEALRRHPPHAALREVSPAHPTRLDVVASTASWGVVARPHPAAGKALAVDARPCAAPMTARSPRRVC